MSELLPCPFCGDSWFGVSSSTPVREGVPCSINCTECGARGPWIYVEPSTTDNQRKAALSYEWNKRPANKPLAERCREIAKVTDDGAASDTLLDAAAALDPQIVVDCDMSRI